MQKSLKKLIKKGYLYARLAQELVNRHGPAVLRHNPLSTNLSKPLKTKLHRIFIFHNTIQQWEFLGFIDTVTFLHSSFCFDKFQLFGVVSSD